MFCLHTKLIVLWCNRPQQYSAMQFMCNRYGITIVSCYVATCYRHCFQHLSVVFAFNLMKNVKYPFLCARVKTINLQIHYVIFSS